jgi:hypothetical protein
MDMPADGIARLEHLRSRPKFGPDPILMYPGAPSEEVRVRCETALNRLVDEIIRGLPSNPSESFVRERFRALLSRVEGEDSEERDRVLSYLEEIMEILGIESSRGLFNEWRYGFDSHDA